MTQSVLLTFRVPINCMFILKKMANTTLANTKLKKWFQRQEPYSMQRPFRKPSNRTHIVLAGIDDQWSADLMDMVNFQSTMMDLHISW